MNSEKIDIHYHQQLSALMDGELAPDQARFLLRRLQHDEELAACIDRWQLAGDVMRGNACTPAPHGFSSRIADAVAAEATSASAGKAPARRLAVKWGGAALAASVAAFALFLVVPQVSEDAETSPPATAVAQADEAGSEMQAPAAAPVGPAPPASTTAMGDTPAVVRARRDARAGGSATRTRQAARSAAVAARAPQRAVGHAPLPVMHSIAIAPPESLNGNPFSNVRVDPPAPRPWPRAVLPQYSGAAFSARYPVDQGVRTFYPFDPKLPAPSTLTPSVSASGEDP